MSKTSSQVKDARGRRVTQLDPIGMYVLRQHNVIEADTLRAITREKGLEITPWERVLLGVGVTGALFVVSLFTHAFFTGDLRGAPFAKSSSLVFMCGVPWLMWHNIRKARLGKVTTAMLKHFRCPHCGYDLRLLPTAPEDAATVCPECGCAWNLNTAHPDTGHEKAESGAATTDRAKPANENLND